MTKSYMDGLKKIHWMKEMKQRLQRSIPFSIAASVGGICAAIYDLKKSDREIVKDWIVYIEPKP